MAAGGGIDPILTPDLQVPMRQMLDQIAPDNPVLLETIRRLAS